MSGRRVDLYGGHHGLVARRVGLEVCIDFRAIYNVNSLERLSAVTAKLNRWESGDRLEVRALLLGDAVATISLLIVGESELFSEPKAIVSTERLVRCDFAVKGLLPGVASTSNSCGTTERPG